MAARINIQSLRKTFPAILDLPSVSTGNNIPKSYHKTRRTWHPNVHRVDQPLRVLETTNRTRQGGSVLKGVKMTMRHLRTLEKSGGVEGTLVSP
jgi:ribosomal protein L28